MIKFNPNLEFPKESLLFAILDVQMFVGQFSTTTNDDPHIPIIGQCSGKLPLVLVSDRQSIWRCVVTNLILMTTNMISIEKDLLTIRSCRKTRVPTDQAFAEADSLHAE
jgi:hypothetical protein